jgi:hypothetical protein
VAEAKKVSNPLRATACHEAGLAVVALAMGLAAGSVDIAPMPGYRRGGCEVCCEGGRNQAGARARVVTRYAGMAAAWLAGPCALRDPAGWHHALVTSRERGALPRGPRAGGEAHYRQLGTLRKEANRLVRRHRGSARYWPRSSSSQESWAARRSRRLPSRSS